VLEPDRRVEADDVVLLTGYEQDAALFESAGVTLIGPQRRPQCNEATMETNVPGLFVAGTAAAGTQVSGTTAFIETSHVHVDRIVAALKGEPPPVDAPGYSVPEQ
jgi:thioredoxin reductase (NADPH)